MTRNEYIDWIRSNLKLTKEENQYLPWLVNDNGQIDSKIFKDWINNANQKSRNCVIDLVDKINKFETDYWVRIYANNCSDGEFKLEFQGHLYYIIKNGKDIHYFTIR